MRERKKQTELSSQCILNTILSMRANKKKMNKDDRSSKMMGQSEQQAQAINKNNEQKAVIECVDREHFSIKKIMPSHRIDLDRDMLILSFYEAQLWFVSSIPMVNSNETKESNVFWFIVTSRQETEMNRRRRRKKNTTLNYSELYE